MTAMSRLQSLFSGRRRRDAGTSAYDAVVVVFTRPDREVARLDIATGPCVPLPGRKRPLVGITNQTPGQPSRYDSLFRVLVVDSAADPWASVVCSGAGCLRQFSGVFVAALADLNRENLRRQQERPRDYDWIVEPERDVLRRWLQVDSTLDARYVPAHAMELGSLAAWARVAKERGDGLYCWSGPGFNPWTTPERIDRYRASSIERLL